MLHIDSNESEEFGKDSRSYVYMSAAHPSASRNEENNLSIAQPNNLPENSLKNYRSAFFEDDSELEFYHRKVKDALQVQMQKDINISIDIV